MKYEMVCTKCLLCFPQDPHVEECPQCGRATVKARKVRRNLLSFKEVDGSGV